MKNNVLPLSHIIQSMISSGLNNLIFSSSAAVYGNKTSSPIPENAKTSPSNPYGKSKLAAEKILLQNPKIKSVSLRYFNAAGAIPDVTIGEAHVPESHLIPNAIKSAAQDREFTLFGSDYPTPDGTCIRDYIHILDLVEAHLSVLSGLLHDKLLAPAYNVGAGIGFSNKEIVSTVCSVTGKKIKIKKSKRRPGDPAELIADPTLIKKDLGFRTRYSDLNFIIKTAYDWYKRNPHR